MDIHNWIVNVQKYNQMFFVAFGFPYEAELREVFDIATDNKPIA